MSLINVENNYFLTLKLILLWNTICYMQRKINN